MPNFDQNNVQSVEFEAPLSSDSVSAARKHFSIDLALALERQLDMDTFPPTPVSHSHSNTGAIPDLLNHDSLDPQVLAHIIKQLQQSLSDVTKDRDELRQLIASSHANEAELQDAMSQLSDKSTSLEEQLAEARQKIKDDEDSISMLRSKVEESRRGLMRLQSENRRQSTILPSPLDLSRAGLPAMNTPASAKRQSFNFTPLTGNPTARPPHGHRRISSVSGTSPDAFATSFADSNHPPSSARLYPGSFGRTSPSQPDSDELSKEIENLRKELQSVKDELEATKHELVEANEAKEASDTCVKALREFIGENNVGANQPSTGPTPLKLPPLPTMATGEEEASDSKKTATGWGFNFWKDNAKTPAVPSNQNAASTSPVSTHASLPDSGAPVSRKFGGFFSARTASISSTTSKTPQLQTNAASSIRDSVSSASDTSSVAEPISPANEVEINVAVRDVTSFSDASSIRTPEFSKDQHPVSYPAIQA